MKSKLLRRTLQIISLTILSASPGASAAPLINGDFETGSFAGWTIYNTAQGGTGGAQIVTFDTAGSGAPSNAARFEVGETSGIIGGGGLGEGGGILQNVLLNAGQINLHADIAATSSGNNADGGTFRLLLDGSAVASHAFGGINVSQTLRSQLNYSSAVTPGTHQIAIEMRRGYGIGINDTPYQFVDNVTLTGSAVPEPSTIALGAGGLTTLLFVARQNRTLALRESPPPTEPGHDPNHRHPLRST